MLDAVDGRDRKLGCGVEDCERRVCLECVLNDER
jgi:hypothetical protein